MLKLALLVVVLVSQSLAGFDQMATNPRTRGLGGNATAIGGDSWSALRNPALLNTIPDWEGSVFCTPGRFGLTELSTMGAVLGRRIGAGGAAIAVTTFGFSLYRELSAGIAFGYPLGPFSAGLSLTGYGVSIVNYGSAWTLGLDAGCTIGISDGLLWGLCLRNVNRPEIGKTGEPISRSWSSGLSFVPVTGGLIALEYEKPESADPALSVGVEYRIVRELELRGGISDVPPLLSAGFGVHLDPVVVEYAVTVHQELGPMHSFGLSVRWGEE